MKRTCFFSLLFTILLSACIFADTVSKYEMIDIGVLIADESEAIAINDNGQVLGKLKIDGRWDIFLWDKDSGLQILDLPACYDLHLNNKGQIAGGYSQGIFIWEKATGFYSIGNFDGGASIKGFNDKGQILITSWNENDSIPYKHHIYIWDYGITKELSNDFFKKFPDYSILGAVDINNKGQVVLIGRRSPNDDIEKSFIWSEAGFRELFSEYGKDTSVCVREFDDNGNMIVEILNFITDQTVIIDGRYEVYDGNHCYFVNSSKVSQAEIVDYNGHMIIRNSQPLFVFCLPSKLKKRFDGVLYYIPGAEIRKLMKPQHPYWFQTDKDVRIVSQNSRGYVVGDSETVYLRTRHAFLAVPYGSKL